MALCPCRLILLAGRCPEDRSCRDCRKIPTPSTREGWRATWHREQRNPPDCLRSCHRRFGVNDGSTVAVVESSDAQNETRRARTWSRLPHSSSYRSLAFYEVWRFTSRMISSRWFATFAFANPPLVVLHTGIF